MWSKHGTRLVNQTSGCTGPLLVIFKEPPSAWGPCSLPAVLAREAAWEPVPPDWSGPTTVHFAVAKGTLVPKGALSYRSTKTYSSGPGGTVIGTYARNGPVPDREHGAREGAADVLEVRLTDQLLMLDATVKGEAAVAGEVAGEVAPRPNCASSGGAASTDIDGSGGAVGSAACVVMSARRHGWCSEPPTSHHRAREQSDEAVGLAPKRARLTTASVDLESLPACLPNTWTAAAAAAEAVGAAAAVVEEAEEKRAAAERAAEEKAAAEPDLPHSHAPHALVLSLAPPASSSASSPTTVGVAPPDAPNDCPIALLLAARNGANGNGNGNALLMDLRFQCL